ncbi:RrF2 family transcriptional regulator [Gordonia sp. DT30]|uniref:RrF2 family transcriptional regulator n=1 Tax=unclassified Gordonia (in: high G+C Gram-positive bacteria) TaxID=2657482 RepID=UPI003CF9F9A5
MQLTRFTDIGLRVVMRLAVSTGPMTTRALAAEVAVPYTHVAKVTGRLAELGVVHARRGRTGGLVITDLGRTARIGWLAASLEGDGEVVDCEGDTPCPLRAACRLRGALAAARSAFFTSLDDHTIGDLVADPTGAVLLTLDPLRRRDAAPQRRAE